MGLISDNERGDSSSPEALKPDLLNNLNCNNSSETTLSSPTHRVASSSAGAANSEQLSLSLYSMSCHPRSCSLLRQSNPYPLVLPLLYGPECVGPCAADSCSCPSPHAHFPSHSVRQRAASILWQLVTSPEANEQEALVFKYLESVRAYCDLVRCALCKCGRLMPAVSSAAAEITSQCCQGLVCLLQLSYSDNARRLISQLGGVEALSDLILVDVCQTRGSRPVSAHSLYLRRYAASALTNLSFGDASCKRRLCLRSHAMWALVEQLKCTEEEDLCQVTASVLRNLSWQADPDSRSVLSRLDAAGVLTRAALAVRREPSLRSLLSALWNLSAHSTGNKESVCSIPGCLRLLCACLTAPAALAETGGGVLRNVSSVVAVREDLRAQVRPAFALLLHQLRAPSLTVVANACGTLWNLSADNSDDQRLLTQLGAVPMLRCLVLSKHKVIRLASASALRNLLSAKPPRSNGSTSSSSQRSVSPQQPVSSPQRSASNESLRSTVSDLTHDRVPPLSPLTSSVHYNSDGRSELTVPQLAITTPMMFSRASSGNSLDSVDIQSLQSSHSSDYSRGQSSVLSPSLLPDTPGEMILPNRPSSNRASSSSTSDEADVEILEACIRSGMPDTNNSTSSSITQDRPTVFRTEHTPSPEVEEEAVVYKTEDTPAQFSRRSSASSSSLSVDSDTADQLLESCISSGLPKVQDQHFRKGFVSTEVGLSKPNRQSLPTSSLRRRPHNPLLHHPLYPLQEEELHSNSSSDEEADHSQILPVTRAPVDSRTFSIHDDTDDDTLELSDISSASSIEIDAAAIRESPLLRRIFPDSSQDTDDDISDVEETPHKVSNSTEKIPLTSPTSIQKNKPLIPPPKPVRTSSIKPPATSNKVSVAPTTISNIPRQSTPILSSKLPKPSSLTTSGIPRPSSQSPNNSVRKPKIMSKLPTTTTATTNTGIQSPNRSATNSPKLTKPSKLTKPQQSPRPINSKQVTRKNSLTTPPSVLPVPSATSTPKKVIVGGKRQSNSVPTPIQSSAISYNTFTKTTSKPIGVVAPEPRADTALSNDSGVSSMSSSSSCRGSSFSSVSESPLSGPAIKDEDEVIDWPPPPPITVNLTINNTTTTPVVSDTCIAVASLAGVGRARIVKKSKDVDVRPGIVQGSPTPNKKIIGGKANPNEKRLKTISGAPVKKPLSLQKPPTAVVKLNKSAAARMQQSSNSKSPVVSSPSNSKPSTPVASSKVKSKLKTSLTDSMSRSGSTSSEDNSTVWITKEEVSALLPSSRAATTCKS